MKTKTTCPIALISLVVCSIAFPCGPSYAILDSFDTDKDGRRVYRPYKKVLVKPDLSCLSMQENHVLNLSMEEMVNFAKSKTLDEQLGILCCTAAAQIMDKGVAIKDIITTGMPGIAPKLIERLNNEHADSVVRSLLTIFAVYNFGQFNKVLMDKDRLPKDDELAFDAKTARFLVKKAEAIQDEGMREFLLDWLIPALPRKEALARQAKREKR